MAEVYPWQQGNLTLERQREILEERREYMLQFMPQEVDTLSQPEGKARSAWAQEWNALQLHRDKVLRALIQKENRRALDTCFVNMLQLLTSIGTFEHASTPPSLRGALSALYWQLKHYFNETEVSSAMNKSLSIAGTPRKLKKKSRKPQRSKQQLSRPDIIPSPIKPRDQEHVQAEQKSTSLEGDTRNSGGGDGVAPQQSPGSRGRLSTSDSLLLQSRSTDLTAHAPSTSTPNATCSDTEITAAKTRHAKGSSPSPGADLSQKSPVGAYADLVHAQSFPEMMESELVHVRSHPQVSDSVHVHSTPDVPGESGLGHPDPGDSRRDSLSTSTWGNTTEEEMPVYLDSSATLSSTRTDTTATLTGIEFLDSDEENPSGTPEYHRPSLSVSFNQSGGDNPEHPAGAPNFGKTPVSTRTPLIRGAPGFEPTATSSARKGVKRKTPSKLTKTGSPLKKKSPYKGASPRREISAHFEPEHTEEGPLLTSGDVLLDSTTDDSEVIVVVSDDASDESEAELYDEESKENREGNTTPIMINRSDARETSPGARAVALAVQRKMENYRRGGVYTSPERRGSYTQEHSSFDISID